MEALALLLAISAFVALLSPEITPPSPKAGDQLIKGLKAAVKEIQGESSSKKPSEDFWGSPCSVMLFTILLGILFVYVF